MSTDLDFKIFKGCRTQSDFVLSLVMEPNSQFVGRSYSLQLDKKLCVIFQSDRWCRRPSLNTMYSRSFHYVYMIEYLSCYTRRTDVPLGVLIINYWTEIELFSNHFIERCMMMIYHVSSDHRWSESVCFGFRITNWTFGCLFSDSSSRLWLWDEPTVTGV